MGEWLECPCCGNTKHTGTYESYGDLMGYCKKCDIEW